MLGLERKKLTIFFPIIEKEKESHKKSAGKDEKNTPCTNYGGIIARIDFSVG